MVRAKAQVVAVFQEHDGIIGLAKLAGALDNGVENRPDIGRRGSDHPEDVAAPGLVSQSLREVARLRLHFVEQTDIADRDYGLIGESLQQADLFIAERLNCGAAQHNGADALVFAQQWHAQHRANVGPAREFPGVGELVTVFWISCREMNDGVLGCSTSA